MASQLLAAEQVVAELRDEFRGEDPLHPLVKRVLDKAREDLNELGERTQALRRRAATKQTVVFITHRRVLTATAYFVDPKWLLEALRHQLTAVAEQEAFAGGEATHSIRHQDLFVPFAADAVERKVQKLSLLARHLDLHGPRT